MQDDGADVAHRIAHHTPQVLLNLSSCGVPLPQGTAVALAQVIDTGIRFVFL